MVISRQDRQILPASAALAKQTICFGANKDTFTSNTKAQKPENVFKRFWNWLKAVPDQLVAFIRKLFGFKVIKPQLPIVKPEKPTPYSHIDPKLLKDPYERQRISFQLADETFPEAVRWYQEGQAGKTWIDSDGHQSDWNVPLGELLTEKAQKLLNTNTELRTEFLNPGGSMGELGSYSPPNKHINGPNSSRDSLGIVSVCHPVGAKYDLIKPEHRQMAYSTYLHEIAHMVRMYAYNIGCDTPNPPDPKQGGVTGTEYEDRIVGALSNGQDSFLQGYMQLENPKLPNLFFKTYQELLYDLPPEKTYKPYWKPLQSYWMKKDFPLLIPKDRRYQGLQAKYDKFLDEADPVLVKQWMDRYVVNELESYMTIFKRAPGIPKDQLQPGDLHGLGAAMYLRDLLRYY